MSNISTNNNKHIKHKYIIDINNNIINSDNISNSSDNNIDNIINKPNKIKKPTDYSNSSVYMIYRKDKSITDIYVGSSCNFNTRKNKHKNAYHNRKHKDYKYKVYRFIRANGKWGAWKIEEIIKVNATCKKELQIIERQYIKKLNATLNYQIPTRTNKEYKDENKEEIKIKNKIYKEKNKEEIKKQNKIYKDTHNDTIICKLCNCEIIKRRFFEHSKTLKHINNSKNIDNDINNLTNNIKNITL